MLMAIPAQASPNQPPDHQPTMDELIANDIQSKGNKGHDIQINDKCYDLPGHAAKEVYTKNGEIYADHKKLKPVKCD